MKNNCTNKNKINQGRNIRNAREAKGLKQDTLARLLNISQQTLSKRERERVLDDEFLLEVSKALEVSFDYLKYHQEESPNIIYENNAIISNSENISYKYENNYNNLDHPINRIIELFEIIRREQHEHYDSITKRLEGLEKKLK